MWEGSHLFEVCMLLSRRCFQLFDIYIPRKFFRLCEKGNQRTILYASFVHAKQVQVPYLLMAVLHVLLTNIKSH